MYQDKKSKIEQLMAFYSQMDESELLKLVEELLTEKTTEELSQQIKEEKI